MNVTDKEIKYSQLQFNFEDSPQEDSAEHESNAGVYASLKITENNITCTPSHKKMSGIYSRRI